jgi:hypothetical protein
MSATIRDLFELLLGPHARTDAEVASTLGVDGPLLQARLFDLKRRGILQGPFPGGGATWTSRFPSVAATMQAVERSGLRGTSRVGLRRSWRDRWVNG